MDLELCNFITIMLFQHVIGKTEVQMLVVQYSVTLGLYLLF